jgi:hypothetical protein
VPEPVAAPVSTDSVMGEVRDRVKAELHARILAQDADTALADRAVFDEVDALFRQALAHEQQALLPCRVAGRRGGAGAGGRRGAGRCGIGEWIIAAATLGDPAPMLPAGSLARGGPGGAARRIERPDARFAGTPRPVRGS